MCVLLYLEKEKSGVTFSENQSLFILVFYRLRTLDCAVQVREQGFINNLASKYTEAFAISNNNQCGITKSRTLNFSLTTSSFFYIHKHLAQ